AAEPLQFRDLVEQFVALLGIASRRRAAAAALGRLLGLLEVLDHVLEVIDDVLLDPLGDDATSVDFRRASTLIMSLRICRKPSGKATVEPSASRISIALLHSSTILFSSPESSLDRCSTTRFALSSSAFC